MQINHCSVDYKGFEQGFTSMYTGIDPLFSITDDLERAMSKDKPYFILPARQAVDGCNHTFYFEVVGLFFMVTFNYACYCIASYTNLLLCFGLCYLPVCFRECSS